MVILFRLHLILLETTTVKKAERLFFGHKMVR